MKGPFCFRTFRPLFLPLAFLLFLFGLALVIRFFVPASYHAVAWAILSLALMADLVFLGVTWGRGLQPSKGRDGDTMRPDRVAALVSLFKRLDNRKRVKRAGEAAHLVAQTEEEYQKEQAEWLAAVGRKKEGRKGDSPTEG